MLLETGEDNPAPNALKAFWLLSAAVWANHPKPVLEGNLIVDGKRRVCQIREEVSLFSLGQGDKGQP